MFGIVGTVKASNNLSHWEAASVLIISVIEMDLHILWHLTDVCQSGTGHFVLVSSNLNRVCELSSSSL